MKILLADDEVPKLENIAEVLSGAVPNAELSTARSVKSAIRLLRESKPDLLVLDMSLPTFDVAPGEPGGRGQGAGGVEVLRYMRFYKLVVPVIVVTQYSVVEERGVYESLSDMDDRLRAEHGQTFHGIIHYGSAGSGWERLLAERAVEIVGGGHS